MATKIYEPLKPLNTFIGDWMQQTEQDLQLHFDTQKIFPKEVYHGWLKENARRKAYAMAHPGKDVWYSTGKGVQSVQARVIRATSPSDIVVGISHLDYMKFPDMGVGIWATRDDVQSQRKARHNQRYISAWIPSIGQTHRPGIMFTAHRLQVRIANYLEDFYGSNIGTRIIQATHHLDEPFAII